MLLLKKLYNESYSARERKRYSWYSDDDFTIYAFFNFLAIVLALMVVSVAIASGTPNSDVSEGTVEVLRIIALIAAGNLLLCLAVMVIDTVIRRSILFVTDKDHDVQNFFLKRIIGVDKIADHTAAFYAWSITGTLIWVPCVIVWLLPQSLYVFITVGLVIAMAHLSRFGYRTSKKLKNHMADPNAHKENNNG